MWIRKAGNEILGEGGQEIGHEWSPPSPTYCLGKHHATGAITLLLLSRGLAVDVPTGSVQPAPLVPAIALPGLTATPPTSPSKRSYGPTVLSASRKHPDKATFSRGRRDGETGSGTEPGVCLLSLTGLIPQQRFTCTSVCTGSAKGRPCKDQLEGSRPGGREAPPSQRASRSFPAATP